MFSNVWNKASSLVLTSDSTLSANAQWMPRRKLAVSPMSIVGLTSLSAATALQRRPAPALRNHVDQAVSWPADYTLLTSWNCSKLTLWPLDCTMLTLLPLDCTMLTFLPLDCTIDSLTPWMHNIDSLTSWLPNVDSLASWLPNVDSLTPWMYNVDYVKCKTLKR